VGALKEGISRELSALAVLPPTPGVCMICTAMSGNGSKTGRVIIPPAV